jgi:alkaline phosphatase D
VQTDFWYIRSGGDKGLAVDPRLDPSATVAWESSWQTLKGSRVVNGPVAQLGPRADAPRGA